MRSGRGARHPGELGDLGQRVGESPSVVDHAHVLHARDLVLQYREQALPLEASPNERLARGPEELREVPVSRHRRIRREVTTPDESTRDGTDEHVIGVVGEH
jgi:hypothetical protein